MAYTNNEARMSELVSRKQRARPRIRSFDLDDEIDPESNGCCSAKRCLLVIALLFIIYAVGVGTYTMYTIQFGTLNQSCTCSVDDVESALSIIAQRTSTSPTLSPSSDPSYSPIQTIMDPTMEPTLEHIGSTEPTLEPTAMPSASPRIYGWADRHLSGDQVTSADEIQLIFTRIDSGYFANEYDTSNGLFTAPITGFYAFSISAICTGCTQAHIYFSYNGAQNQSFAGQYTNQVIMGSIVIQIYENDAIGFVLMDTGTTKTIQENWSHTWLRWMLVQEV